MIDRTPIRSSPPNSPAIRNLPLTGTRDIAPSPPVRQTVKIQTPKPPPTHWVTGTVGKGYSQSAFLEKTWALANVLQKFEQGEIAEGDPHLEQGIAIMKEHLFLVMELERITA